MFHISMKSAGPSLKLKALLHSEHAVKMKIILSMSKMYEGGPGKSAGLKLRMAQAAVVARWLHKFSSTFLRAFYLN